MELRAWCGLGVSPAGALTGDDGYGSNALLAAVVGAERGSSEGN